MKPVTRNSLHGSYGRFIERVAEVGAASDWLLHEEALAAAAKAADKAAAAKSATEKVGTK